MNTQSSYDAVAAEYADRIYDELRHKPLDCELLQRFTETVAPEGLVCDLGCGPGHVARHLQGLGLRVCGVDLSPGMVHLARQRNPGIEFEQGDLTALDVPEGHFAGVVAFYSLIHIVPAEMPEALREIHRILSPGGLLLAAFHLGTETLHLTEWWGHAVRVDFHFHPTDDMSRWLRGAGFEVLDIIERDPYPGVEHASRRAYVFARSRDGVPS